jgi:hypothetical protein
MSRYFLIAITAGLVLLIAGLLVLSVTPKRAPASSASVRLSMSDVRAAAEKSDFMTIEARERSLHFR